MFAEVDWPQTILLIAGLIVAFGVIWTKGLRPVARVISNAEKSVPVIQDMTEQFSGIPDSFKILKEIVSEFRTDSGTTLRDVVNRLEANQQTQAAASEVLAQNMETVRVLSEQDRATHARLAEVVDRLAAMVHFNMEELKKGQASATVVRDDLANDLKTHLIEEGAGRAAIADDLEASHRRAEAHPQEAESGAAADAAMRRDPDEKG